MSDYISRADAIETVASITMSIHLSDVICDKLLALPSAEIPTESTNTPTNTPTDLISRADAMGAVQDHFNADGFKGYDDGQKMMDRLKALPSADAESDDLIIKGAKGIQDGLYNITDGKLFKYKAKGGTVRTYPIVPSADAEQTDKLENQPCLVERNYTTEGGGREIYHPTRQQGEWIPIEETLPTYDGGEKTWLTGMKCSNCGKLFDLRVGYYFCPNCGAMMHKGSDDE